MGSENAHTPGIAFLQPFLRHNLSDCFAGEHSFRYGKSVSNQVTGSLATILCAEDRSMVVTFEKKFYYMGD